MTRFLRKLASAGDTAGGLSRDDEELLASLLDEVRPFAARRDIIREGDRPDHVRLIVEGWACRYKLLGDGSRQITAFLIPGDFCDAQITLFDQMDHNIGALGECQVAIISKAKMEAMLERPRIARALWWAGLVDEAVLRAWIVNLGRRDAFERVGNLVCEMHARLRNVGLAVDGEFTLPVTQEELGDALGLTSVHVNRTLKRLRDEELVSFRRQHISISDVGRLQRLVGFDPNYLHLPRSG